MIFEMNGQLGNCIVVEETCVDLCSECAAGSGKSHWNFCHVTHVISLSKEFCICLVCVDGKVECSTYIVL